jgi:site-specific DNA recombinase
MKRVGIYCRVSTDGQKENTSIPEQKDRLLAFCKAKGWVCVDMFIDPGYSGASLERPAMERMIKSVVNKKIDVVLVTKLDRLSRSQKDTLYLIEELFLPNNVDFVSVAESFDTTSSYGRAMIGILSAFAQLERELISERTFSGRVGRAKEGKWHGGGTHPIGYDYIDGELVVNDSEADQVRKVYDLYASGVPITSICERMEGEKTKHGDWHHPETVANVLDNPLYSGAIHFDDATNPGIHTAIIPKDLWETVRDIRSRIGRYPMRESRYILTGLVYCNNCGARYFVKKNPNGNKFYCCHSRAKVNKKMIKDPSCKNKNWSIHELEEKVYKEIKRLAKNPNLIRNMKKELPSGNSFHKAHEEIDGINIEIGRLMDLYQRNDQIIQVGEIAERIDELYQRKVALMKASPDEGVVRGFSKERAVMVVSDLQAAMRENNNIDFVRYSLLQLIDRIEVDGENVHFLWSFAD